MDDDGTEYADVVADGVVQAVGDGPPPDADETHDVRGALVLPGLGGAVQSLIPLSYCSMAQLIVQDGGVEPESGACEGIHTVAQYAPRKAGRQVAHGGGSSLSTAPSTRRRPGRRSRTCSPASPPASGC
jgi:hypothetical protein